MLTQVAASHTPTLRSHQSPIFCLVGLTLSLGQSPVAHRSLQSYATFSAYRHLQNTAQPADEVLYSAVGYHAITLPQDLNGLREDRRNALGSLLAIVLDPENSAIFLRIGKYCVVVLYLHPRSPNRRR